MKNCMLETASLLPTAKIKTNTCIKMYASNFLERSSKNEEYGLTPFLFGQEKKKKSSRVIYL